MFRTTLIASAAALFASAAAAEITVSDAYIRSATPSAPTGAAFMVIENTGDAPMRLVTAASEIATRVELHTHNEAENGMMQMVEIEDGIEIAPGATHELARGGDHVMFMGLNDPLIQGETVPVTLGFEDGTEVSLDIMVDRERQDMDHGAMDHGDMNHGDMDRGASGN
ncbi:copper chaperone PCu(A)C [Roseivivax sp. THAF30]|uniref:copper chaperone PCu(A)C n=1 Tax=Roseivivax sp. THAF30 TaxID=2587852 RepID=UPI001267BD82|nr:copper chaperone PCu(A)C [Roseivivax sp. THAF30]QFT64273.1 hypothetical protein FIU91_15145 [Roseivivax sp. THAF30]